MSYFKAIKWEDTTGSSNAFKNVDGKPRFSDTPYLYDIAEGNVPNHTAWSKTGYNPNVSTGTEDVWINGATITFPSVGSKMYIKSSSANDISGGQGINQVRVTYLDNGYNETVETIWLSGTTASVTSGTILRVNNFRASVCGGSQVALGNIQIGSGTQIYSMIGSNSTMARNSAYTVPSGLSLYVTSAAVSAVGDAAGKDAVFTLLASYDDKTGSLLNFYMPYAEIGVVDGSFYRNFELPIKLPSKTDIKMRVIVGNNSTIVNTTLRGWLE